MDHLIHPLILFMFLVSCALQDWRTNRITNWLTIPAFVLAWITAIAFNNLALAALVCFGCYAAWSCGWMGAADGKLATLLAALSPPTFFISTILLALTFLYLPAQGQTELHVPAVVWFCAGSGLYTLFVLARILLQPI